MLCHHAADVSDYKSPDFDFSEALRKNTMNIKQVIPLLKQHHCDRLLLTGSVFEQGEGEGSDNLQAVSPYGLSKGLTSDVFRYFCAINGMRLGKFVIPNPFGPYEEFRFTSFLAQNWLQGKEAAVSHPDYVRDNIPVSLLAKSYARFTQSLESSAGFTKINPSFRPESQGKFTQHFANEMRKHLSLPCALKLNQQKEFPEPKVRINTNPIDPQSLHWNENAFWDTLAAFYIQMFRSDKVS